MNYECELNEEQLAAVQDTEGAVEVFAGAGSGKTRVLTYRIAYLIEKLGVRPWNILAITFTNKAAKEMNERINKLIGESGVWISTFHSLCARILRTDIIALDGYSKNFTIYSEQDSGNVCARILKEKGLDVKEKKKYLGYISQAKNMGMSPDDFYREAKFVNSDIVYEVYRQYESELLKANALDFDDLLLKTVKILSENKEFMLKWRERFRYILVDEFQDTNAIQLKLLCLLTGRNGNIFVVGDDDQSIYSWRGAIVRNMLDFNKIFSSCKIHKLERNYRSTANILNLANKIIKTNKERVDKKLWTDLGDGAKVVYRNCYGDKEEADYVLNEISGLIAHNNYKPNDIAILVRANSLTRVLEERMNMYGIAYKVYGGFKFYERKEILDLIAYLKAIANPDCTEALLRIINFPRRGIGDTTIDKLLDAANSTGLSLGDVITKIDGLTVLPTPTRIKIEGFRDLLAELRDDALHLPVDKLVEEVILRAGIKAAYNTDSVEDMNRMENIEEFKSSIIEYSRANPSATLDDYLESVSLISSSDDDSGESVTIATIHSVKGLEFRVCFIVGCEENILPSRAAIEEGNIDEERRCMYVAVTRARERLYLTSAETRFRFGKYEKNRVSCFLTEGGLVEIRKPIVNTNDNKELDKFATLLANRQPEKNIKRAEPASNTKDISAFNVGVKVTHPRYGDGVITARNGDNATIEFGKLGNREFMLRLAPITLKVDD